MTNEPVAWINRDEKEGWLNWDKNTNMPINIPLYPHPAQTFTDEDVEHLVKRWFNCHPEAKLDEQLTIPLYSIVTLCKGLLKK